MITFSALLNIILFSSLSVVLLKNVFRDNRAVLKQDIRFLLMCMVFILFRLLIPIESPITNSIPINHIYPNLYILLKASFYTNSLIQINILAMLKAIWLLGAAYFLAKVVQAYFRINKNVKSCKEYIVQPIDSIVGEILSKYRLKKDFRIVVDGCIKTPYVFGIFKPYIVLPPLTFTEKELFFILKHEIIHYYRGDLVIRLLSEITRAVYWWNPFVSILERLICNAQEINVDFKIMKELPKERKLEYSECLVKIAKKREMEKINSRWVVAFQKENSSEVYKRISLMLGNMDTSRKRTVSSVVLSILILGFAIYCPNLIIFEPYSIPDKDAEGTFDLKGDDSFYIRNSNGTYSLYLNGQYEVTVMQVADDKDVKVYNRVEEVKRDE